MIDRAQQALYLLALEPISETIADPNSDGFRPNRRTADAIAQCFKCLCQNVLPDGFWKGISKPASIRSGING
ncbi:hypothetical protein PSI14_17020 [Xenorhabdus sp. XENO-2]|uniref:Group II intron reverse transcriptase/maturase n=2 Tax=Xenorhabdus anantnagensis TaxID=3025875 RepID=A0ABT5LVP3_9GAMM|nr:hypothetical protein [Xenorhabdus anantnagensis]